jgi:hypothetical protein
MATPQEDKLRRRTGQQAIASVPGGNFILGRYGKAVPDEEAAKLRTASVDRTMAAPFAGIKSVIGADEPAATPAMPRPDMYRGPSRRSAGAKAAKDPTTLVPGMTTIDGRPGSVASGRGAHGENVYDNASAQRIEAGLGSRPGAFVVGDGAPVTDGRGNYAVSSNGATARLPAAPGTPTLVRDAGVGPEAVAGLAGRSRGGTGAQAPVAATSAPAAAPVGAGGGLQRRGAYDEATRFRMPNAPDLSRYRNEGRRDATRVLDVGSRERGLIDLAASIANDSRFKGRTGARNQAVGAVLDQLGAGNRASEAYQNDSARLADTGYAGEIGAEGQRVGNKAALIRDRLLHDNDMRLEGFRQENENSRALLGALGKGQKSDADLPGWKDYLERAGGDPVRAMEMSTQARALAGEIDMDNPEVRAGDESYARRLGSVVGRTSEANPGGFEAAFLGDWAGNTRDYPAGVAAEDIEARAGFQSGTPADLISYMNPWLDDEDYVTLRDRNTGEETTIDAEDAAAYGVDPQTVNTYGALRLQERNRRKKQAEE